MVLTNRTSDTPLTWLEVVSFAKKELHSIKWSNDQVGPIPEVNLQDVEHVKGQQAPASVATE